MGWAECAQDQIEVGGANTCFTVGGRSYELFRPGIETTCAHRIASAVLGGLLGV